MTTFFQTLTALMAIIASVLWFCSVKIKTPKTFSIHVVKADGFFGEPLGGNPLGGQYVGNAYSDDLINLANALKKQSKLSAYAAICAGISAISQAVSVILETYFQAC